MAESIKQTPLNLDPALLQTGEAVARLAIDLAKVQSAEGGEVFNAEKEIPAAWKLLRLAYLEIDTFGRERTLDDYKRFAVRSPKELVEASKPPSPPPYREPFDTLFNRAQNTIYLPSKPIEGSIEKFEWRQLMPWDAATQHPSEERKTRPYQIAWAVIDARVREGMNQFCDRSFADMLCFGFSWRWDWDELPEWTVRESDQMTGVFDPWVNSEEWEMLAKCAHELPRPHNRSVCLDHFPILSGAPSKPKLCPEHDEGLPGPTPPEGTSVETLYDQAMTWAEAVLESWKKKVVQFEFDAFWTQGKQQGFLWADVLAMAIHTKKHKGGIKWHSGTGPRPASLESREDGEKRSRSRGRMWTPRDFYRKDVGW